MCFDDLKNSSIIFQCQIFCIGNSIIETNLIFIHNVQNDMTIEAILFQGEILFMNNSLISYCFYIFLFHSI